MKLLQPFKTLLYLGFWISFLSGTFWWIFSHWIRVTGTLGEEHHPLEHWLTRIHGIIAYALLLLLGYLVKVHIEPGIKKKKRLKSGWTIITFFSILILTAFPILYANEGFLRDSASQIHTYLGLTIPIFLAIHIYQKVSARAPSRPRSLRR